MNLSFTDQEIMIFLFTRKENEYTFSTNILIFASIPFLTQH